MCDFTAECTDAVTLDPYKRVCYSNGLVLGVDEFLQEELYLLEKHRLHNRALHGYGTICGLDVSVRDAEGDAGPEIVVSPGLALNPVGHEIRVPQPQCARLDEWLLRHPEVAGSPPAVGSPAELSLHVVLCYRECKTDEVPIPGGPCRTLDDSTAPSRIADAFELALRTEPPEQFEEDAIRAFGDLLRAVEIVPGGTVGVEEMAELVRSLASGSPPGFEPFFDASPPGVQVAPEDAEEVLRAAFRVWVTEVRPRILPDGRNCASGPPREECVLLARLDFPVEEGVDGSLRVAGDASVIAIEEDDRPYLLQTRVLQELWIADEGGGGGGGGAPVITVHADLDALDADDHLQYLLVDPVTRALVADLDADGIGGPFIVSGLREASANGEAVRFEQAVKVGDEAGAPGQDVRGTYPDVLTVVGLQERPVAPDAPAADEVLTWTGAQWEPRPLPAGGGGVGEAGLTRIVALNWVHGQVGGFPVLELDGRRLRAVACAFGRREPNDGARVRVEGGSLDGRTYELFSEQAELTLGPGLTTELRIAGRIVPLDEINVAGGVITSAVTATSPAPGAALVFDDAEIGDGRALNRALDQSSGSFLVLLRGDFVVDEEGRAIDAEHLRSALPTGDRPQAAELGIQGGRFESWFRLRGRIDINLATRDELLTLPGINPARADAILARRPFGSVEELREVNGIGPVRFDQIRDLVTV